MDTKACSLTDDEIAELVRYHSRSIAKSEFEYDDYNIERINYLNKRLKAEKKEKTETPTGNVEATAKGDSW